LSVGQAAQYPSQSRGRRDIELTREIEQGNLIAGGNLASETGLGVHLATPECVRLHT
jgi:hypothetical protein